MTVYHLLPHEAGQVLRVSAFLGSSVFLYIGPDQLLPLASFVGAAIGIILIIWHRAVSFMRKVWQFFSKK